MAVKKERIAIPIELAAQVLFEANRTCCVCTTPGKPVQLHHIDENPSNNGPENLSVLCLDCHNDTMIKGGFGRKLDALQVLRYKGEWVARIRERKVKADELASLKTVTSERAIEEYVDYKGNNSLPLLVKYLNNIIIIHKAQLLITNTKWDEGTTASMLQGRYEMIDFYEGILKELATFYPPNHFTSTPTKYFSEMISSKYSWYRLVVEPYGVGTGGSIVGVSVAGYVEDDIKLMVSKMANELIYQFELEEQIPSWQERWNNSLLDSQS